MDFNKFCKDIIWFCIMFLVLLFTGISLLTCGAFIVASTLYSVPTCVHECAHSSPCVVYRKLTLHVYARVLTLFNY